MGDGIIKMALLYWRCMAHERERYEAEGFRVVAEETTPGEIEVLLMVRDGESE